MAYARFFKRVRLAPGVGLNFSRYGPSLSLGVKGAHVTVGPSGIRRTVGLPGTGLFYTSRDGWHSGVHSSPAVHGNTGMNFGVVVLGFFLGAALVLLVLGIVTH